MKNTIIALLSAVFLTAYFILQDNAGIAAASAAVGSTIADAPLLLAASDHGVAAGANKSPQSQPVPGKGKPLEPEIRDAVREHVNTSHEGLVEEKTDKGVEVKLKGRFRTAPVATVDEKGEVTVRDYTAPPAE